MAVRAPQATPVRRRRAPMPELVDGRIRLEDLRDAFRHFVLLAPVDPPATAQEFIDWLLPEIAPPPRPGRPKGRRDGSTRGRTRRSAAQRRRRRTELALVAEPSERAA